MKKIHKSVTLLVRDVPGGLRVAHRAAAVFSVSSRLLPAEAWSVGVLPLSRRSADAGARFDGHQRVRGRLRRHGGGPIPEQ